MELTFCMYTHTHTHTHTHTTHTYTHTHHSPLCTGLLGITPSPNNGTAGYLHHMLTPSLLPTLPPPQTLQGVPGNIESCPYPVDEATYNVRSFCDECVCRNKGQCADVSKGTIDDSNLLLNLITDDSKHSINYCILIADRRQLLRSFLSY